jgi:3-oxoacyl-[acyl-carrier protein] reductase
LHDFFDRRNLKPEIKAIDESGSGGRSPERTARRASERSLTMDLGLSGRVALVTGASKGIGRATALTLAAEGMDVALVARNRDALEAVKKEIEGKGRKAVVIAADLADPAAAQPAIDAAVRALGKLDLLVNCTGATKGGNFLTLSDADWTDSFGLKFFTYVRMSKFAWPHLKASRGGIVHIAGIAGRTGASGFDAVGAVNAALALLTKAQADRGVADGVRVNAIHPGTIDTGRLTARLDRAMAASRITRDEALRALLAEEKTERVGRPEEVAALVAMIAGKPAEFMQGAIIDIDGGKNRGL